MTKEGFIFPLPFIFIAVLFFYISLSHFSMTFIYVSVGFFFLGLLVMLFFRDPVRKSPKGGNLIISPADGKIIRINDDANQPSLSIFLSVTNVHVNRAPVSGVVQSVQFIPGKFHIASADSAQSENQRNEIEIKTDQGLVKMHQVSGSIARRCIFYKKPGDAITAGERVGLIRFGSRVDLFLPSSAKIDITLKRRVVAGETILGRFQ